MRIKPRTGVSATGQSERGEPPRPRVAFVVQRCGAEVNGGAELHCLQMAQRMSAHWRTEVLTTCALDYMEWGNHYPEGEEMVGGVPVRRFRVDAPRNVPEFDRLSGELLGKGASATLAEQELWMRVQGPVSTPLLAYLEAHREDYDAFIFFGYLYATTYLGLPLVRSRAYLAPLAHDEWAIHFRMWDPFFALPRGFLFNTGEERRFLARRFPGLRLEGPVVGVGIEPPARLDPEGFRQRYRLHEPFLLYVGRVDASKGCGEMIEAFRRQRGPAPASLRLVLIGREVMPIPFDDHIVHLGFVSEQEKWDAMAACDWLVMPSAHESLSMVLLEAWAAGRPALVNAASDVLVGHCERARAGFWYASDRELGWLVHEVSPAAKRVMGRRGRDYVARNYSWTRVEQQYREFIGSGESVRAPRPEVVPVASVLAQPELRSHESRVVANRQSLPVSDEVC